MARPTVIVRDCPDYDPDRVARLAGEALDRLGLVPAGRVLVKPNCVASGPFFPHAFTRPEFLEGVCRALAARAAPGADLAVGERCGITIPTRYAFRQAGYPEVFRRTGFSGVAFEECTQVPIPLYHQGRLREVLYTPEPVARADFFVNVPKFKAHPWTTVTFSLKNYIGIQDDRHRLIDHDHRLDRKLADLQYITQPRFIAIDGVIAGEGRMLTPVPFDLGLALFGNNQVAFDAVCCAILGLDPREVEHVRLAHERGFGPLDLGSIAVEGDVSLDEARERAQGFRVGRIPVEEYFAGTNIRAYGGPPPGNAPGEPCWGGCPGALEEAIEILRLFDRATDEKFARRPRLHLVFGRVEGPLDVGPGEDVVFIGDCATWSGHIDGQEVRIESRYSDRSGMDPREARDENIYAKMLKVRWQLRGGGRVHRIAGCPVSVAEQVLALVRFGGLRNPYFDPGQALAFNHAYLSTRARVALHRLLGVPYNADGPVPRGASRPPQSLPPAGASTPWEASAPVDGGGGAV